jgi:hypothetical protein
MNRPTVLLTIGLISFVLFLAATVPASLLFSRARDGLDPRVRIYQVDGTISAGRAAIVELAGLRLTDVEWRLRPLSLALFQVSHRIEARSDAGPISAVIVRGPLGGIRVSKIKGSLPLAQVFRALSLPPLPVSGRLDMGLSGVKVKGQRLQSAKGSLEIDSLRWDLASPPLAFGSYHLDVGTEADKVVVKIKNTTGPVDLTGEGEITAAGTYGVRLKIRPQATAPAGVAGLIQQLGNPDAEGWYRLQREGAL